MSAQKILITCLGLASLMALGGCNDIKSPSFQPRSDFIELKVCEAGGTACPTDGSNCDSRTLADPSLIPVDLSTKFCALAQYSKEQLEKENGNFSVPKPEPFWQNVSDDVVWQSDNTQVAAIDAGGNAIGVSKGGPVTISATLQDKVAETHLRVTEPKLLDIGIFLPDDNAPSGVAPQPGGSIELLEGAGQNFVCRAAFSSPCDSTGATLCDITQRDRTQFVSSANNQFSVDNNGAGFAEAATPENQPVEVTCTYQDRSEQPPQIKESDPAVEVTVCGLDSVTGVQIDPDSLRLPVGGEEQLSLLANYTSCTTGEETTLDVSSEATWASTDATIAPVDEGGLVTGLTEGQAEITGSFAGNNSAPLLVVVSEAVVDSLRMEGPAVVVALGQPESLSYTAYAELVDADTGEPLGEEQLLNAPDQPFAAWSSSAPTAISFADTNSGKAESAAGATPQIVEVTASYQGVSETISTRIVGFPAIKSLEITPSVACIGDALSLSLLGDDVQPLTAHAIVEFADAQGDTQSCSAPITEQAEWKDGGADILSALISNPQIGGLLGGLGIPGLDDVLGVVGDGLDLILQGVDDALGDCSAGLALSVGSDPLASPIDVSNEAGTKGAVSGAEDNDSLVGGACVIAEVNNESESISAESSVLVATELQDVCETLLSVNEPSKTPCSELLADSNDAADD